MENYPQLKAALKKSAELITAAEKDRDRWRQRAESAEKQLKLVSAESEKWKSQSVLTAQRFVSMNEELREVAEKYAV